MRINHNMMAMNTHRQLGVATDAGAKSMEKLSSGYRINRAGDDAAGLSISEKMRNQVRGLDRASSNAQDGISLIQTAEGALDESHAILKRMRELTVQAGNQGTLQDDDMEAINDEYGELAKELTGIAERTEFNGKKLLEGDYKGQLQIGANQDQAMELEIITELKTITKAHTFDEIEYNFTLRNTNGKINSVKFSDEDSSLEDGILNIKVEDEDTFEEVKNALKEYGVEIESDIDASELNGDELVLLGDFGELEKANNGKGGLTAEDLDVDNLDFTLAGTDEIQVRQVNTNLGKVDNAIKMVSEVRSHLGANQNRLEHTISNLDNAAENIQASESRIRDVDMAKEMMEQTRQNILQQASTSMLAQANMAPQTVLQLLG